MNVDIILIKLQNLKHRPDECCDRIWRCKTDRIRVETNTPEWVGTTSPTRKGEGRISCRRSGAAIQCTLK
jgi:hypothetical protein